MTKVKAVRQSKMEEPAVRETRWIFTSWIIPFNVETSDLRTVRPVHVNPGSARIPVLRLGTVVAWIGYMWEENGWLRGRGLFTDDPIAPAIGKRYPIGSIINPVDYKLEERDEALHYVVNKFQLCGVSIGGGGTAWPVWQDSVIELVAEVDLPDNVERSKRSAPRTGRVTVAA